MNHPPMKPGGSIASDTGVTESQPAVAARESRESHESSSRRRDNGPVGGDEPVVNVGTVGSSDPRDLRQPRQPALTADDPELAVLLNESTILADRDSVLMGAILTLASIAAVLTAAFTFQAPRLCSSYLPLPEGASFPDDCLQDSEQWMYLMVPLPILALAGILLFLALNSYLVAQLRSKVEEALRLKTNVVLPPDAHGETHPIELPSSHRLTSLLLGPRRAPSLRAYRAANAVSLLAIVAVLFVTVMPVNARATGWYAWALPAIYVPLGAIMLASFVRGLRSRQLTIDTTEALEYLSSGRGKREKIGWLKIDPATGRRPLSYLLLPRPLEAVLKSTASLGALVVVRLVTEADWPGRWPGLAAVGAFELLAYQARYMFNDAIDASVDRAGARASRKGRAPYYGVRTKMIIRAAALARLGMFVGVAMVLPGNIRTPLLMGGAAVIVLMAFYDRYAEFAREKWSLKGSDVDGWLRALPHAPATTRLFLVAPGYGVRASVGASVAVAGWPPITTLAAIGGAMACLEGANVALGWAMEGAADTSKDGTTARPQLGSRPHIAWLLRHAGLADGITSLADVPGSGDRGDERVLLNSPRVNGPRVWNLWMVACLSLSSAAGYAMNQRFVEVAWSTLWWAAIWALVPGLLLLLPSLSTRVAFADWFVAPAALGAAATVVLMSDDAPLRWAGGCLPLLTAAVYAMTRLSTYHDYLGMVSETARGLATLCTRIGVGFLMTVRYLVGFFIGTDLYPKKKASEAEPRAKQ